MWWRAGLIPVRDYLHALLQQLRFPVSFSAEMPENPATGFDDGNGLPYSRFGSNDSTLEGFYDLAGLQIPNGGSSAQYRLSIEAVDPLWSAPLGPYQTFAGAALRVGGSDYRERDSGRRR